VAPGQDHSARLGLGGEVVPGQNFVLEGRKERFASSVVEALTRPIDCLILSLSLHSNVELPAELAEPWSVQKITESILVRACAADRGCGLDPVDSPRF